MSFREHLIQPCGSLKIRRDCRRRTRVRETCARGYSDPLSFPINKGHGHSIDQREHAAQNNASFHDAMYIHVIIFLYLVSSLYVSGDVISAMYRYPIRRCIFTQPALSRV